MWRGQKRFLKSEVRYYCWSLLVTNVVIFELFTWLKAPWIIIIHFPPALSAFPGHNLIFHLVYPPTLHLPPHPPSLCSPAVFPICDGDRRLITFSRPPSYRQNVKIAAEMSSGAWHGRMRAAGKLFFSLLAPRGRRSQWVSECQQRSRVEWAGESHRLKVTHRAKFPFACGFPGWSQKKEGISREWQLLDARGPRSDWSHDITHSDVTKGRNASARLVTPPPPRDSWERLQLSGQTDGWKDRWMDGKWMALFCKYIWKL